MSARQPFRDIHRYRGSFRCARNFLIVLAAGGAGAVAIPSAGWAGLPGASALLTRAPYLTDLTTSSVRVNWATSTQRRGVVRYGPPGTCTASAVTAGANGVAFAVSGVTEYQHSVLVTGLTPGAAYCYRISDAGATPVDLLGSNPSPVFSTRPPAASTAPITFDVLGDWGTPPAAGSTTARSTRARQRWTP